MIYDLIILGSGPAGLTAAIYAARKKMNTLVLAKQVGGQSLMAYSIENFPGFLKISGAELIAKMKEQVDKYGVAIKDGMVVAAIEKKDGHFLVKTEQRENFEAKTIIIALGKMPKKLEVSGVKEFEGRGVSFCTTCDAPLFAGKDVAVVGGGNAGLKSAEDLVPYAKKIYVLQHGPRFIGDELTIERLKKTGKVEFITNAEILEIKGKKPVPNRAGGSGLGFVEGLVYEDLATGEKKDLAVAGVFVNIGQIPNTDFLKGFLELNEKGEIIIDCRTNETSAPGIFAAGDVSNGLYKQCVIAAGEGAKAALSAHEYLLKIESK